MLMKKAHGGQERCEVEPLRSQGLREPRVVFVRNLLRRRFGSAKIDDEWWGNYREHRFNIDEPNGNLYRLHVAQELLDSRRHSLASMEELLRSWDPQTAPAVRVTAGGRRPVWLPDGLP